MVRLSAPASQADIAALCRDVVAALADVDDGALVLDIGGVEGSDMTVVDALARVQLTARRLGRGVALRAACPEIRRLLDLAGLADVVPIVGDGSAGRR